MRSGAELLDSGTIHGNGTITSDVNNLGTISPVGTLTFAGNLTLFGSSTVIMELTGYGNGVGTNARAQRGRQLSSMPERWW